MKGDDAYDGQSYTGASGDCCRDTHGSGPSPARQAGGRVPNTLSYPSSFRPGMKQKGFPPCSDPCRSRISDHLKFWSSTMTPRMIQFLSHRLLMPQYCVMNPRRPVQGNRQPAGTVSNIRKGNGSFSSMPIHASAPPTAFRICWRFIDGKGPGAYYPCSLFTASKTCTRTFQLSST